MTSPNTMAGGKFPNLPQVSFVKMNLIIDANKRTCPYFSYLLYSHQCAPKENLTSALNCGVTPNVSLACIHLIYSYGLIGLLEIGPASPRVQPRANFYQVQHIHAKPPWYSTIYTSFYSRITPPR